MPKTKIFEGKTTAEAIEKGMKEFNVSRDKVDIKIIEEDKRSFFSILTPRVVKVEIKLKETQKSFEHKEKIEVNEKEKIEAENIVKEFLKEFIEKLPQKEIQYEVKTIEEYIEVFINGKNISYLIGYRGENLNAIQTLLNAVLKNKIKTALKVTLDICGYKKERQKILEELAERVAKKVIETGRSVTLDPMRPYERKIIHSKLQENSKIKTHSIGEEPYRKIVVSLN